jgi:hypothetical protein
VRTRPDGARQDGCGSVIVHDAQARNHYVYTVVQRGGAVSCEKLPIAPSWRTGHDGDAVVLGHGDEGRLDDAGPRVHHRRHAVDTPASGGAAEASQHAIDGFDQVRLVLGLGEHPPELPRARKGPEKQMGVVSPGGFWQFVPVPLQLFAGRVLDLDRGPALHPRTRLAVRAQVVAAKPPGEALVAQGESEGRDLVEQSTSPHVLVLGEAGPQVGDVLVERVWPRPPPFPGDPLAVQIGTDRLAIPLQMTGDGRYRPALLA